jgi:hypothetical protein
MEGQPIAPPLRPPNSTRQDWWLKKDERVEILDRLSGRPHLVTRIVVDSYPEDGEGPATSDTWYQGRRIYKSSGRVGDNDVLVMP